MNNISSIINPKSIAVIGASNRQGSVGLATFRNLLHGCYKGVLYPVHSTAKSIQGVKAYPTLSDIPDAIDLAIIMIGPEHVPAVVEEAARKNVKGCLVISAGFKEVGGRGIELENQLKKIIRETGIRIVGPNCLGIINTHPDTSMNASFARKMPKPGNIAFISQSGALCTSVLDFAEGRNVGFSKFVSFGNKADVNEVDFLEYLRDDPDTALILMYLEDISDGHAFMSIARQITFGQKKPILAVKSGRSKEGAKAAASHTGSLAGSDANYDAIFYQSGIYRVESVNELFHYAIALSKQPAPKSNRIAIITNAGGPGIMATDAAIRHGLKLASFSEHTKEELRKHLPATASIHNPVDVIGDATHKRYESAIRTVLQDDGVDGAIVILTPQAMTDILETAQIVPNVAKDVHKPILTSFMGMVDVSEGIRYLEKHGIPNYIFPEAAARTMAAMVRCGERLDSKGKNRQYIEFPADKEKAEAIIRQKLDNKEKHYMPEKEASEILQCYGFPLLKSRLIKDASEIDSAIEEIGLPAALKIISPDIVHKSDAGGVRIKLGTSEEIYNAYDEILANVKKYKSDARIDGILMVQMAKPGVEVIIGSSRDSSFGPLCMFGLGGIFVEAMKDVTFRLAPMWDSSAENMIKEIRGYKLLEGVRGNPHSDTDAIRECILRLSQMVSTHPEISELDINPLIVYPRGQGCVVADCRILLAKPNV